MTDYYKLTDQLAKTIFKYIDLKTRKLFYDVTFASIVMGRGRNGKYIIYKDNIEYEVYSSVDKELKNGQPVWVCIPAGSFRKMYISGIRVTNQRQAEQLEKGSTQ